MRRLRKAAIILALVDELKKQGSWCGETHLQKAVYFLQELADVPLEFDFILYKHGPFSFDLRDGLTAMRADRLLDISAHPYPFGASLYSTETSERIKDLFPKTLNEYRAKIELVAKELGDKGVAELERLGTALYATKEKNTKTVETRAKHMHQLKPHVSIEQATCAIQVVDEMLRNLKKVT